MQESDGKIEEGIEEKKESLNYCENSIENGNSSEPNIPKPEFDEKSPQNAEPSVKVEHQVSCTNRLRVEGTIEFRPREEKQVQKQSHSTQTSTIIETTDKHIHHKVEVPVKESHSTQTVPEETFSKNHADSSSNKENKNITNPSSSNMIHLTNTNNELKSNFKTHQNKQKEYYNSSPKKYQDESFRKVYQKRKNFSDEKKVKIDNLEKLESKTNSSPYKISYAKKAMVGLENISDKYSKVVNGTSPTFINNVPNEIKHTQTQVSNELNQTITTNGTNKTASYTKQASNDRYNSYGDKKNSNVNMKNGYTKSKYNKYCYGSNNERNNTKEFKYKDKTVPLRPLEVISNQSLSAKEKFEDIDSKSQSEKSSVVSELSSPTELSSGQNTPPEKLIVRKMEQKIANEINKSFEEKLKQNFSSTYEEGNGKDELKTERVPEEPTVINKNKQKAENKKKKIKGKSESEKIEGKVKDIPKTNKKKKKKTVEVPNNKIEDNNSSEDFSFLPNFMEPNSEDVLFGSWEGTNDEKMNLISEMDSILSGNDAILKSLGLNNEKINFSKLPLHSDMLMMLPSFGWGRPKLKIEDIFAPAKHLHNDLFTRRNITNMKSTKPEEFFASVVDHPILEKGEKKKETNKSAKKEQIKPFHNNSERQESTKNSPAPMSKKNGSTPQKSLKTNKTGKSKTPKDESKEKVQKEEPENKSINYGIVEAVNTWLQEQRDPNIVLSVDSLTPKTEVVENEETILQKNGESNPMHALSHSGDDRASLVEIQGDSISLVEIREGSQSRRDSISLGEIQKDSVSLADFREGNGCIRVANVINDRFICINKEFRPKEKATTKNSIYRSSSLDAKLSEGSLKKHFKFLTDSASYCQDLISDVRNGLPSENEFATEELCDPKQSVRKYYTLSPKQGKIKTALEIDSDNEVFDALEYKFHTKGDLANQESRTCATTGTAKVSVADSGIHSDMDSPDDTKNELNKDASCKLQ